VLEPAAAGEFPQGLKPNSPRTGTARLKPCPFKAACHRLFQQLLKVCSTRQYIKGENALMACYTQRPRALMPPCARYCLNAGSVVASDRGFQSSV